MNNKMVEGKSFLKVKENTELAEVLDDILDYPEDESYFLTGSFLFESNTDKSDIDIVIKYDYWYKLRNQNLELQNILFDGSGSNGDLEANIEFSSFHCEYKDKIYNLIIVVHDEFLVWRFATNSFKKITNSFPKIKKVFFKKERRVDLFETLKSSYRRYKIETDEIPY